MQSNSSDLIFSRQDSPPYSKRWQIVARGGVPVYVEWNIEGAAVKGCAFANAAVTVQPFLLDLSGDRGVTLQFSAPNGKSGDLFVDVTLSLSSDQKIAELICNVPLDSDQFYNGVIDTWLLDPGQDDPAEWPDMPTDQ